ncbi:hypothetical protein BX667DRAFT_213664 [Coemansia mojavensis]|nr:hypothetical protein BX667DRAFT_213664 [Coemansia mojavensis]KAJ1740774.1 hypothetical protein LPJ68_003478 [Coemansia sp. RSA 1086]
MAILSMLIGSGVGLTTGMYAAALQGRQVMKPRISYGVYMAIGSYIGYLEWQAGQLFRETVYSRREELLEKRAQRLAARAAKQSEA